MSKGKEMGRKLIWLMLVRIVKPLSWFGDGRRVGVGNKARPVG